MAGIGRADVLGVLGLAAVAPCTEQAVTQLGISADIMGVDKHLLPTGYAEQAHESWPRHDLGYTLAENIARQVHSNPLKDHR